MTEKTQPIVLVGGSYTFRTFVSRVIDIDKRNLFVIWQIIMDPKIRQTELCCLSISWREENVSDFCATGTERLSWVRQELLNPWF